MHKNTIEFLKYILFGATQLANPLKKSIKE